MRSITTDKAPAAGGLAAAAAFLERSAELTLDPDRRRERILAAAKAKRDTGAFESPYEAPSLVVTTATDVADPTDNLTSLREAVAYAASKPEIRPTLVRMSPRLCTALVSFHQSPSTARPPA